MSGASYISYLLKHLLLEARFDFRLCLIGNIPGSRPLSKYQIRTRSLVEHKYPMAGT